MKRLYSGYNLAVTLKSTLITITSYLLHFINLFLFFNLKHPVVNNIVKYITLTLGKRATVDDDTYNKLSKHKWSAQPGRLTYYALRGEYNPNTGKTTTIKMHHAVAGNPPAGKVVDHINGNGLDNRRANLRVVTPKTNSNNVPKSSFHHKKEVNNLKKDFKFIMPLVKEYTGDDGFYHVVFGLSTTKKDLQGDTMTTNALQSMLQQIKNMDWEWSKDIEKFRQGEIGRLDPVVINDGHNHQLKDLIGPVTDAYIEKTKDDVENLMVDLKVRKMWEEEIRDIIAVGIPLGGSIEGEKTKTIEKTINGELKKDIIDDALIRGGALTTIPAAWNLRGTAKEKVLEKSCVGSVCSQITKSLESDQKPCTKGKKQNKTFGDDKLKKTDKNIEIPTELDGIDETLLEKIKTGGEPVKNFFKELLSLKKEDKKDKEPPVDPDDPELNPPGKKKKDPKKDGDPVKKTADEHVKALEKSLKDRDDQIKALEKRLDDRDDADLKKTKKDLLKKSFELQMKLKKDQLTPEEQANLTKEIKEDLEKENGVEMVKRDIKAYKKALEEIPEGDLPPIDKTIEKQKSADEKRLKALQKKINSHGIEKIEEDGD